MSAISKAYEVIQTFEKENVKRRDMLGSVSLHAKAEVEDEKTAKIISLFLKKALSSMTENHRSSALCQDKCKICLVFYENGCLKNGVNKEIFQSLKKGLDAYLKKVGLVPMNKAPQSLV